MIIARSVGEEPDLLIGFETEPLIICDLAEVELKRIPPPTEGWTHEALESINVADVDAGGWNAYLGDGNWVGSSEV